MFLRFQVSRQVLLRTEPQIAVFAPKRPLAGVDGSNMVLELSFRLEGQVTVLILADERPVIFMDTLNMEPDTIRPFRLKVTAVVIAFEEFLVGFRMFFSTVRQTRLRFRHQLSLCRPSLRLLDLNSFEMDE